MEAAAIVYNALTVLLCTGHFWPWCSSVFCEVVGEMLRTGMSTILKVRTLHTCPRPGG